VSVVEEMAVVTRLWAQLRVPDRAHYLERTAQAVIDEFDALASALAAESQRPLVEIATLELLGAIDALRWLADNAGRLLGAHRFALPRPLHPLTRASAGFAPLGVVGVRGAEGAPFAEPLAVIGTALLAGNGALLAPAEGCEATAARIAGVLARAGIPEGLVRVTRSLEGCASVVDQEAATPGADAMIVLADASLRHAVDGALWGACAGGGRLAGSLKRVYVDVGCCAEFIDGLARAAEELAIGDPLEPGTQLAPPPAGVAADAASAIEEAVGLGAVLHCGGLRAGRFAPAVLSEVPAVARIARSRVPGPLVTVTAVPDSATAVALANSGDRSLGASIWSSDRRAAVRVARELRARVVWGNDHPPALPVRQTAVDALAQCRRPQLIAWDPPARRPPWRYPYDATQPRGARTLAALQSLRDGDRERALRDGGPSMLRLAGRALRR
jgi:acyl-CoA reductase-like NAD-dependent aldehyde dehydrogenase